MNYLLAIGGFIVFTLALAAMVQAMSWGELYLTCLLGVLKFYVVTAVIVLSVYMVITGLKGVLG